MTKTIKVFIGDILKQEFLEPLNMSAYRLAKEIGVSSSLISQLLNGKVSLSPDMTYKLGLLFGTGVLLTNSLLYYNHFPIQFIK